LEKKTNQTFSLLSQGDGKVSTKNEKPEEGALFIKCPSSGFLGTGEQTLHPNYIQ
jgi:hypothetical protein